MGGGRWDIGRYEAEKYFRNSRGLEDFGYSAQMMRRDRREWRAAPMLDPFGIDVREARDSTEHPNSTPIAVLFDVTGSMGMVPRILQQQLPALLGLLLDGQYVTDPQILFGAIGDAESDRVPLQIGQFESDNRMDEQLRHIFLEGNGGGQQSESYELAAWFMANKVAADAFELHQRKGYLFIIGDEFNKPVVRAKHLREVLGAEVIEDVDVAQVYAELQRNWHVFFVLPKMTSYFDDPAIADHWQQLLGEGFLRLDDPAAISDLIAVTIGVKEGTIDLEKALADVESTSGTAAEVRRALGLEPAQLRGAGGTTRGRRRGRDPRDGYRPRGAWDR